MKLVNVIGRTGQTLFGLSEARRERLRLVLASLAGSGIVVSLLKPAVGRLRPK